MSLAARHTTMIRLLAETAVHVGIGQSTGALDLPVARERATHLPFIPGSGVKGAFRVWAVEQAGLVAEEIWLFGKAGGDDQGSDQGAGALNCSDARLLLLPVRCLSDSYKWVTSPALLKRWERDCARSGLQLSLPAGIEPSQDTYLGKETSDVVLALEELEYERVGDVPDALIDALSTLIDTTELKKRLVILNDRDLVWFARYGLQVMARNKLNDEKISESLWYEETLPTDTVMYVLLGNRAKADACSTVKAALENARYIQVGGNETLGQGWFAMAAVAETEPNGEQNG